MPENFNIIITVQNITEYTAVISLTRETTENEDGELRLLDSDDNILQTIAVQFGSELTQNIQINGLTPGTEYSVAYYSDNGGGTLLASGNFTTLLEGEKRLYGSVAGLSRKIDSLYGSQNSRSRAISKLYGSVDGKSKLTYFRLGELPRAGLVTYYTDESAPTTATARILSSSDLIALSNPTGESSWEISVDGVTFDNVAVKEVILPTWATTIPDGFLSGCSNLDTLVMSPSVTTIGDDFLRNCSFFDSAVDLFFVNTIGENFLRGCVAFNQPLATAHLAEIPSGFLAECPNFNQALDFTNIVVFGDDVLRGCESFNQPLTISSATTIGDNFLYACQSFNQRLEVPRTVESIGEAFLYDCFDMTNPVICNASASIIPSSDYTFSTHDDAQSVYTQGLLLGGRYAQEWKNKFPNRNTNPFRNLGYAAIPVLYATTFSENENSQLTVNYGVSVWDIDGTYNAGSLTLSESVSGGPYVDVATQTSTGLHSYIKSNIASNTRYSYKIQATNTGGETVESNDSFVSKPGLFTISAEDVGYIVYNSFERQFTLNLPANGNVYPQSLTYRLKKASESEFGNWINIDVYSASTAGTVNVSIPFETGSEYVIEFKSTTTAGERVVTYNQAIIPEHIGPTQVEFTYDDAVDSVQDWLSTFDGYEGGTWFVGGQSKPRVTITNAGETTDGASLVEYEAFITRPETGYSNVIPYGEEMTYTFAEDSLRDVQPAGMTTLMLTATDSLEGTTTFYQGGAYLSWDTPTFSGSAQRLEEIGALKLSFEGLYSGLQIDALNDGKDLNSITIEYKVTDYAGDVITDWTTVEKKDIQIVPVTTIRNRSYSGSIRIVNFEYTKSLTVEIRASDHFMNAGSVKVPLELWRDEEKLQPAVYEVEVWDWRAKSYVADLSTLVVGDLNISWELNDVEELNFSIDLTQFEKRCKEMGVEPQDILTPYKHDIRVKRNNQYIIGTNLVETNVQVPNDSPVLINLKCTGFLNLFKDQYLLDETWSGYTYAQMARKLIYAAQQPDCLVKNPTGDIDASYWLNQNGPISSSTASYGGTRCIMASRSGTGWVTAGTQMDADSGENVMIDFWVRGQSGVRGQLVEKQYITQWQTQTFITYFNLDGNWQHIQVPYTTTFKDGWICVEMERTNANVNLYVDDFYVYAQNDNYALCDMKVNQGVDTASAIQNNSRQVSYSLQNIKEAIVNLTKMEDDNFDFDFSYDRTFNCYARKGIEKPNVDITYPGNVDSLTIDRSAANLVNKIYHIGTGIGDARLQVDVNNGPSRQQYGTRETIITNSNIDLEGTLLSQAVGELYDRKDPTDLPSVTIKDGSVNPNIVQVGDSVPITIQSDSYLGTINDIYRIVKIDLSVSEDDEETMKITLEPPLKRPEKKMVRYIRDSLVRSNRDWSKQWNEVRAYMLVGNEYVNVAQGKPVYGNREFSPGHEGWAATDNDINTYANMYGSESRDAITIDLGAEYPIDYIKMRHYFPDGRTFYGEHLTVGTTVPDGVNGISDLETVVWSFAEDQGYVEISDGHRSNWIQEDAVVGGTDKDSIHMVRYIRESHIGSTRDNSNIWTEIDAWMSFNKHLADLIKRGAKIFYSDDYVFTSNNCEAPIDRNTDTWVATGEELPRYRKSVTIDLGGLYPLEYIKLFHYVDGRVFHGSRLSIGTTLPGEINGIEDLETVLWADDDNAGFSESISGRQSTLIQHLPNNVNVKEPVMVRYIKDTYTRSSADDTKCWHAIEAYVRDVETRTLRDVAMGKIPTFTAPVTNPIFATDDMTDSFAYVTEAGPQSAIIDLGKEYPLDYIKVKHHGDGKTTYGDRLSIGTELTPGNEPLDTIIWQDVDGIGYVEKAEGRWSGWIQDNPKRVYYTGNKRPVRYIRDCICGSNVNSGNHWVEIEAYVFDHERWRNVALGKIVTPNEPSDQPGHDNPQIVTDGNLNTEAYFDLNPGAGQPARPQAVTIDLGQEYYIDYIVVRHYYGDERTYNNPVLSVSNVLPENDDGIQSLTWVVNDVPYRERNSGCGFTTKWVQGEL